jgi:hypothetical protein
MPDKQLSLNQQLALMPVAIPDSVIDFLEDFNYGTAIQTDSSRAAFDPEYLKVAGDQLKTDLEKLRTDLGRLRQVQVEQAGRDIPGGFLLRLDFEKGSRGMGLLTRLKERTILKVIFVEGEYNEAALKDQVKNPK